MCTNNAKISVKRPPPPCYRSIFWVFGKVDFMATLHPLAPFYNTPEQLQLMKNFVGDKILPELELDINRIERVILNEVWEKLNKGLLKDLEEVIAKEVFKQINGGMKKIFK